MEKELIELVNATNEAVKSIDAFSKAANEFNIHSKLPMTKKQKAARKRNSQQKKSRRINRGK